jgi:hypothetical protein
MLQWRLRAYKNKFKEWGYKKHKIAAQRGSRSDIRGSQSEVNGVNPNDIPSGSYQPNVMTGEIPSLKYVWTLMSRILFALYLYASSDNIPSAIQPLSILDATTNTNFGRHTTVGALRATDTSTAKCN